MAQNISSIILLGFPDLHRFRFQFSSLLVVVLCGVISGNVLVISLYLVSNKLRSPMYLFITQLSLCDLLVTTDVVPTLLHSVLHGDLTMTLTGCLFQLCLFVTLECSECLLLAVMSYDRYVAICSPLRYHTIISDTFCVASINAIWFVGFTMTVADVVCIHNLYFCGPHIIDHFYCDLEPLVQLSCSDTSIIHTMVLVIGVLAGFCPFLVIVTSYMYIAITILKIPSNTSRCKAFSTCSSHLIVVSILYGTLIMVYMFPTRGPSMISSKVLSLMYTVVTPLLNPIIYTLRNKDFIEAFHKLVLPLHPSVAQVYGDVHHHAC